MSTCSKFSKLQYFPYLPTFLPHLTKLPLGTALLSGTDSTETLEVCGLVPGQDISACPFFAAHFSFSVIWSNWVKSDPVPSIVYK